ncbi:MAG: regulatory protein GemA [Candidatus Sphingomonas phytovorans]|nr:regulatory protein GemA [Sphingomonas sp.]WEK00620.1 MAG: regulatory protein GemA [Sphingomonas sp.]
MSRAAAKPAAFAPNPVLRALIAKVHIAKKDLGLEDDLYRGVLLDVAGKSSAGHCTEAELIRVLKHFEARGFTAKAKKPGPRPADLPFARKARALWISLHQLCAIDDPSERALEAFCRRQMKVAKMQWADEPLAYRMIEGLKAMGEREGWDQSMQGVRPEARVIVLKRRLLDAIHLKLAAIDPAIGAWSIERTVFELGGIKVQSILFATLGELDVIAGSLGRKLRQALNK